MAQQVGVTPAGQGFYVHIFIGLQLLRRPTQLEEQEFSNKTVSTALVKSTNMRVTAAVMQIGIKVVTDTPTGCVYKWLIAVRTNCTRSDCGQDETSNADCNEKTPSPNVSCNFH